MSGRLQRIDIKFDLLRCQLDRLINSKPLVSVCMITYNHEPFIRQAIEGVLAQQTNFEVELVIGEDCSTDRTREICFEYQKKHPDRIHLIISEQNVGAHTNFKRTLQVARGKYIALCEGDDYWHHPQKLQKQVDCLEAEPDVGLVHSDVVCHYVDTGMIVPAVNKKRNLNYNNENILADLIIFKYYVRTCSAVIRKNLLDEIYETCQFEFSENFLMGDIQMWIELAHRSKVKYIDESLATYNYLPESACRSRNIEKNVRFIENSKELALHYANKYGGDNSERLKKEIVRRLGKDLLDIAYQNRKRDLAIEVFNESRKYQVSVGPIGYLRFVGSLNIATFYLAKIVLFSVQLCRKSFMLHNS